MRVADPFTASVNTHPSTAHYVPLITSRLHFSAGDAKPGLPQTRVTRCAAGSAEQPELVVLYLFLYSDDAV